MENQKITCLKNLYDVIHKSVCEINEVIENGVVEKIEISKKTLSAQIILNDEHNNIRMNLNKDDYEEAPYFALTYGDFEKEETHIVRKIVSLLPENMVCFDIGANVGWYTLHIKAARPCAEVYSFEPGPTTFKRLTNNMIINGFSDEKCMNIGLFNKIGVLDFFYDPNGSGASSMVNLRDKSTVQKMQVPVSTIDTFIKEREINRLDFIKCDVEGSEFFVYQGGLNTIREYKPIVFSEMLRKWSAKFGYHPNDIISLFGDVGYKCFVISSKNTLRKIEKVTEETVETNYFFLHEEKHKNIISKFSN